MSIFKASGLLLFCTIIMWAQPPVSFTDSTAASRITFQHAASKTPAKFLPETMGGGVALLDSNNDGRLDIFFTNGAQIDEKMTSSQQPDKRAAKYWNRLFLQNNDGTFVDVTEKAGVAGTRYDFGVAVADYDNDGWSDLYVTGYGGNTLYRNNGNGTFTDVSAKAGVVGGGWSSSAGFFDYNHDGKLDLFVCRYLTWSWEANLWCGERKPGYRAYCHPDNYKGIANLLYRNNGDGTFTDVSKAAGIVNPEGKSLGVAFNDFDRDGWTDVFVANDSVRQFLYRNKGDGTFEDVALLAGVGYNEDGKTFAGMGADFNDYDNDGWPDIADTALGNEMYALFRNAGDGSFTYTTNLTGLGEASLLMSGWGIKWFDYDHDGRKDLFVAQSHVLDTIEKTTPSLKYLLPPLMMRNAGNRLVNVAPQLGSVFTTAYAGRGAAFGDLDNDGDVDIVMATLDQKPVVMRNEIGDKAKTAHWLLLSLTGTKSNRDGIGAQIKLISSAGKTQYQFASTASSYQSASDKRVHFGLGSDERVKTLEIRWPSGTVQMLTDVPANQILKVTEPAPKNSP
ncbi:MAG TPA: CRTAC1 family protein [Blastocatellia bacterium]|nr:CRTAC1 family protein [Blastocatellia bacterium]